MNAKELREKQAPLKKAYKNNPEAALITHTATGTLGNEVNCRVETKIGTQNAGLHKAAGGDGSFACSGDMLMESLAACAGVTLQAVAVNMGLDISSGAVRADGDLDFRGTLGVSKEAAVGFRDIRLHFDLETSEDQSSIEKLIELTERYCVVYQTLNNSYEVDVSFDIDSSK